MTRKRYYLGVMLVAWLYGLSGLSADLRCDLEPDTSVADLVQLSASEQQKADALTAFAMGLISVKPDAIIDYLLEALRKDPSAELPLRLLLNQINTPAQAGKVTTGLATIAGNHPAALRVNLAAVLLLKGQNNILAEELGQKTLHACREQKNLSSSEQKAVANLAGALASIYASDKKFFPRGDNLLEDYLSEEAYRNNYYLLEAAVLFYNTAAKNADDSKFLWFWSSDKEKYSRLKQLYLEKIKTNFANPAEREIFASIAGMYEMLEMPEEVERLLLNRMITEPDNPSLFTALAAYYYKSKQYTKSMLWWRTARNKFPLKDDSLLAYADAAFYARFFRESINAYQSYIDKNPKQNVVKLMQGLALIESGDYEWAARLMRTLPDSFMSLKLRGLAEDRMGNHKEALALMQQAEIAAQQTSPESLDAMFYLYLMMLTEKNKLPELTIQYAELVAKKFSMQDPVIANAIGYTYADLNVNLAQAEKLIRYAVNKEPDKAEYYDSLAWVLYRQKNFTEAARYINIAIERQEKIPNAVIAEHAGDIFYATGNVDGAIKYWKLALIVYSREINRQSIEDKLKKALLNNKIAKP